MVYAILRRISCFVRTLVAVATGRPPSLTCWLEGHPRVASNIIWQFARPRDEAVSEVAWPQWTAAQKAQLVAEFESAWRWYHAQTGELPSDADDIRYPPPNRAGDSEFDDFLPDTYIDRADSWAMYVRWIALQLVVEIGRITPWSVTGYDEESLQALFDSRSIMTCAGPTLHVWGTGNPWGSAHLRRSDNVGMSLIAPPRYTLAFLVNQGMVGADRMASIAKFLQWVSDHCQHFIGQVNYQSADDHWQYRGLPPITRILEGTNPIFGQGHWTFGCHGTSGLIRNVLRALNIPVHITVVCGHGQVLFPTESLYLDHCDNPYNQDFLRSGRPASELLVDHDTYVGWFGASTDNRHEGCDRIGEQILVLLRN